MTDERAMQFRVGLMALASLLVVLILLASFGDLSPLFEKTYVVYIKFPDAPGVAVGMPVHESGVPIGTVSDVRLTGRGQVLVTARIDAKYKIYQHEVCYLRETVLGDTWLDIEPASNRVT